MNVVGHQAVGMELDTALVGSLAQPVEIELAIFIGEKYRLSINAALNDVLRNSGKMEARSAGHGR